MRPRKKARSPRAADRYADAGALADDVARYRDGRAVSAHRETALERLGRWARRYQVALDGFSALLSAPEVASQIVGIVIGSTIKGLLVGVLVGWFASRVTRWRRASPSG